MLLGELGAFEEHVRAQRLGRELGGLEQRLGGSVQPAPATFHPRQRAPGLDRVGRCSPQGGLAERGLGQLGPGVHERATESEQPGSGLGGDRGLALQGPLPGLDLARRIVRGLGQESHLAPEQRGLRRLAGGAGELLARGGAVAPGPEQAGPLDPVVGAGGASGQLHQVGPQRQRLGVAPGHGRREERDQGLQRPGVVGRQLHEPSQRVERLARAVQLQRQLHQLPARRPGLLARQPRPQSGEERRQRLHRAGAAVQRRELEERVDVVRSGVRVRGQMAARGLGVACADGALSRHALQPLALGGGDDGRIGTGERQRDLEVLERPARLPGHEQLRAANPRQDERRIEPQRVLEEASLPCLTPGDLGAAEEQTGRGQRVADQRRLPREQRRGLRAVAGGELELGQRLEDLSRRGDPGARPPAPHKAAGARRRAVRSPAAPARP